MPFPFAEMLTGANELLQRIAGLRAVIVGDLMLDRYISGRVHRISPEAPVPIVEVDRTFERPGGAANVAANVCRLGASTTIIGRIGVDMEGERLRAVLAGAGLDSVRLVASAKLPTTVKTRIVAQGQQIVRVDREVTDWPDTDDAELILDRFFASLPADIIILSDYAKGVLSPEICREVIRHCTHAKIPVIVDPKGLDYARYAGATAITPNQLEAAQALGIGDFTNESLGLAQRFFLGELRVQAAVVTQGEHGMTLLQPDAAPLSFPAACHDVADVTGAGDTVASVFALTVAAGLSFAEATRLANGAAGLAVRRPGTVAISPEELGELLPTRPVPRLRRTLAGDGDVVAKERTRNP